MRRLATRVCLPISLLIAVLAPELAAQSRIAGQWVVRYDRELRTMHGGTGTIVRETARLSLVQRGDSLFGHWQGIVADGETAPPTRPVRGVLLSDTGRVEVELPPPENDSYFAGLGRDIMEFLRAYIHNMPTMIPLLELTVRGDSLVGTRRTISLDHQRTTPGLPLSAVRDRP